MGPSRRQFVKTTILAAAAVPLAAEKGRTVVSIDGPLVSTGDLKRQRNLFEGVFGLAPVAEQTLSAPEVERLFGVSGHEAETVLLETPGTRIGVRLVQFDPTPELTIREGAAGYDSDALKVVDFVVDRWDEAVAVLREKGFDLVGPPAEYALPREGRFTEGHVKGPDGVICALLRFHDSPRERFVRVTDRLFSEILGVSAPVADLAAVTAFYRALGLGVVFRYEIETESFQKLVGMGAKTRVTGTNFGLTEKAPMIGIIHYGLPEGSYRSLRDRSRLPHRGLVALRATISSVEEVAAACRAEGFEVLAPPASVTLEPHGRVRALAVRAPHGVVHHFVQA